MYYSSKEMKIKKKKKKKTPNKNFSILKTQKKNFLSIFVNGSGRNKQSQQSSRIPQIFCQT
jgi:hypothetical protein